jgi:hypothetical protein
MRSDEPRTANMGKLTVTTTPPTTPALATSLVIAKKKARTRNEDPNSPWVQRNRRLLQSLAHVPRAEDGVGEAIYRYDVRRVVDAVIKRSIVYTLQSNRGTVKLSHALKAFKTLYGSDSEDVLALLVDAGKLPVAEMNSSKKHRSKAQGTEDDDEVDGTHADPPPLPETEEEQGVGAFKHIAA